MAKVLVIDDEAEICKYFQRLLTEIGYDVQTAGDSPSALACADDPSVDLIVSDLNMPGAPSEMALIRALREKRPDCPIVVVSGYPTGDRLKACGEMGVVEFLTKPFEMPFIVSVLTRLLNPESKTRNTTVK